MTRTAIVGHFGIFVKVLAHAVTDILLHHAEPELLHIALHRPADIADPVARNSGGNTAAQPSWVASSSCWTSGAMLPTVKVKALSP